MLKMQLPILFPQSTGGVFLVNDHNTPMSVLAHWGKALPNRLLFAFGHCWVLRSGKPYPIIANQPCLHCNPQHLGVTDESICIPMAAQGKATGLFYLSSATQPDFYQQLAAMTAEQIALALANLQLREQLKYDSIRDPLTQLFNRRYLEESLTREMHRATRDQQPISVILLDVDHFKCFNDTYGHQAGDSVLQAVAKVLVSQVRSSDIVCRYGGEEMIIVLPNTSLEIAYQRAENIRNAVQALQLKADGTKLPQVTISLGIAVFSEHGKTSEALVRQADAALYRAKANGRNRTEIAEDIVRFSDKMLPKCWKVAG